MLNLIDALRKTADDIETDPTHYHWGLAESCNCGLLTRNILQINEHELYSRLADFYNYSWRHTVYSLGCPFTELPIETIFYQLGKAGLTKEQIGDIERLSDPQVRERAKLPVLTDWMSDYSAPAAVTKYFRAMADMLEEEQDIGVEPETVEELELVTV